MLHKLCALLFGLSVALLLLEGVLRMLPSQALYYWDHELLSVYNEELDRFAYRKNARLDWVQRHGDLMVFLRGRRDPVSFDLEPRRVLFQTDSLGFRNDSDYRGEPYLLVGDSFIVGSGTSQRDILSSQLRRACGLRTHNAAFIGGIFEYARWVLRAEALRLLNIRGETTHWKDDTHWNAHGIRAAALEVCRHVRRP